MSPLDFVVRGKRETVEWHWSLHLSLQKAHQNHLKLQQNNFTFLMVFSKLFLALIAQVLNLGTTDILAWKFHCCILYIIRWLTASGDSTHQRRHQKPSTTSCRQPKMSPDIVRCPLWGQNHLQLRTTVLQEHLRTLISFVKFVHYYPISVSLSSVKWQQNEMSLFWKQYTWVGDSFYKLPIHWFL
jgi:hypothetical protein